MKFLAIALLALTSSAWCETYKCTEQGKSVYSDRPCSGAAVKLNIGDSAEETERLRQAAIKRQEAQEAIAAAVEKVQNETRQNTPRQPAEPRSTTSQNPQQDHCDRLLTTAKNASNEADLYLTPRFKADAKRRQKEAEDEHFTKCYGTVKVR